MDLRETREVLRSWMREFHHPSLVLAEQVLSQPVPLDKEMGHRRVRLGPAARLGPQPPGVRLKLKITHRGIIGEILAKGK